MKRVVEAQLCKLIIELLTAGITVEAEDDTELKNLIEILRPSACVLKRQKVTEEFDSRQHLKSEMGVLMSWLLICHCVVTAPLFSSELSLPKFDDDDIISILNARLPLGVGYDSIEGIASSVLKRTDQKIASLSAWTTQQLAAGRNTKVKLPMRSDLMYSIRVELPREYSTLISHYYNKKCGCGNSLKSSALCLSCGVLVNEKSKSEKVCCSMKSHSLSCGSGQSIFMLLGESRLVAIDGKRFADIPPLYVDAHGEDDPRLDRGKPLFLSQQRVNNIARVAALSLYGFDTSIVKTSRFPPYYYGY